MLAAIDIGNTHITIGLFQRAKLVSHWRITSAIPRTEDELWLHVQHFFGGIKKAAEGIQGMVIASVVPQQTDAFVRMAAKYTRAKPVVVSGTLNFGMEIRIDDPSTIGADRLCNAVAVHSKFGGPAIAVDFGTATTFDVVSKNGEFLGGVIAPGIAISAGALHHGTAQLPSINLQFPDNVIGRSTMQGMQSGVMYGALEACDGIIRRIKRAIGKHAIVVATGGFAKMIADVSHEIRYVEPFLVLNGARLIHERVTRNSRK